MKSKRKETEGSKISQHAPQRLEERALEWGQHELTKRIWTKVRLRRKIGSRVLFRTKGGILRMPEGRGEGSADCRGLPVTKALMQPSARGYPAWAGPRRQQRRADTFGSHPSSFPDLVLKH